MGGGVRRALSRRHQGANHAVMAWRRSLKDLGRSSPSFARSISTSFCISKASTRHASRQGHVSDAGRSNARVSKSG
jgi:hypothetical protein